MDETLRTETIRQELSDMLFKNLQDGFEGGLIDEEKFLELMDVVDSIQEMTFEELHELFDLMRGAGLVGRYHDSV